MPLANFGGWWEEEHALNVMTTMVNGLPYTPVKVWGGLRGAREGGGVPTLVFDMRCSY